MATPPTLPNPRLKRRVAPRAILAIVVVAVLLIAMSGRALAVFYTDKLWFADLGFSKVFTTLIWARVAPAVIFSAVMFVLLLINLVIADRIAPQFRSAGAEDEVIERYAGYVSPYMGRVRVGVALLFGIIVGAGASSQWRQWILYQNRVTWGIKDAQFHKDIGFYVFELPMLKFVVEWLFVTFFVTLFVTTLFHYLNGGIRFQAGFQRVTPQVKAHLSVLLALMAFTKTAQYWYGRYDLVFSHRGRVDGATFTDIHAQLPALEFLALISVVGGILFVANIWRRGWTLPVIAAGLWAFIAIIVGTAYPAYMQRFQVQPSERSKEKPYIERNIEATRNAYGLNNVEVKAYDGTGQLDANTVKQNNIAETLLNVRLWDPLPLEGAVQGPQGVKGYYKFDTPSVDRYRVGSVDKQLVLVAVRGLDSAELPSDTWTNRHLAYTHGQAAVVVQGNVTQGVQNPSYLVKDIPPTADPDLSISQPDIYFSTHLPDFAIAGTKEREVEVDGSGNEIRDTYKGSTGIAMSSFLRKAAFATRFGDVNVLLSGRVTPQSKMLFTRDVVDRVKKVAPFLVTDSQAYPVILPNGTIQWVVDAYTVTDKYPYSQELRAGDVPNADLGSNINYARNSVKAVVDAYNGTVSLYVVDPKDPLIRAYRKAFPSLFKDVSQMPAGLAEHLRYPTDLFKAQTRMLEQYHITSKDADAFFGGTEQWRIAPQPSSDTSGTGSSTTVAGATGSDGGRTTQNRNDAPRVEPQYLMMQLPGDQGQEFVLATSFVPQSKNDTTPNRLSAFVAVRNDGFGTNGNFGKMTVYTPGAQAELNSEVFAANQIQRDPEISSKISLTGQLGSQIVRGDLQLLPIGNSILYAQPFFITGEAKGSLPGFSFIALSYENNAVFGTSVKDALDKLFPGGSTPNTPIGPSNPGNTKLTPQQRLDQAAKEIKAYQDATKAGKFEEAGKHLAALVDLLNGQGSSSPTTKPGSGTAPGGTTTTTSTPTTSTPTTKPSTSSPTTTTPTTGGA